MTNISLKVIHIFIKISNFCVILDYKKMFISIYVFIWPMHFQSNGPIYFCCIVCYEHIPLMKCYSLINHRLVVFDLV